MMILALLVVTSGGCSGGPAAIHPPRINADEAAQRALKMYDTDGDGYIAGNELEKAPALKAAMKTLNTDGDAKISEEEIAARIRAWEASQIGLMSIRCSVTMDGRPVNGAEVVYEPEAFLGGAILPAVGITDQYGNANLSILKENRPSPDSPPGVQFGLYSVRITRKFDGGKSIPAKYNSETTLGQEVSFQDAGVQSQIVYKLKSR